MNEVRKVEQLDPIDPFPDRFKAKCINRKDRNDPINTVKSVRNHKAKDKIMMLTVNYEGGLQTSKMRGGRTTKLLSVSQFLDRVFGFDCCSAKKERSFQAKHSTVLEAISEITQKRSLSFQEIGFVNL